MIDTPGISILIAEDSAVIQDILKLVLTQRGHKIDIAQDGSIALDKLLNNEYDLALIDFHLPIMTGLEAVTKFLTARKGEYVPRLIAMTGDTEGLLSAENDCEQFAMVLPKPIEIDKIIPVVESQETKRWLYNGPTAAKQTNEVKTTVRPLENLNLNSIVFPDDFQGKRLKNNIQLKFNTGAIFEALIIAKEPSPSELNMLFNLQYSHLTPVIDLTGTLSGRADISVENALPKENAVMDLVKSFTQQSMQIHPDFLKPETLEEALLARIFMSGKSLNFSYNPITPECIKYNTILSPLKVIEIANQLKNKNMLDTEFETRIHFCPNCSSSRLSVREECPECLSPRLKEEFYIHHFKCAWQAQESDFKSNDLLICPKCRHELIHFGKDYDKPGSKLVCASCGQSSTDPVVGFFCMDCNNRTDGEAIPSKDMYSYHLTDRAIEFLEAGRIALGNVRQAFRFSDLPIEIIIELNNAARDYLSEQKIFCLASISYKNLRALERESGIRLVGQARDIITTSLTDTISQQSKTTAGTMSDYILIHEAKANEIDETMNSNIEEILKDLSIPLEPVVSVYSPEELAL